MGWLRALGFLTNDPQRSRVALRAMGSVAILPTKLDGMGAANCMDGNVLLTKHPVTAEPRALPDYVGAWRGRVSLMQFRDASDLQPGIRSAQNIGPFRFKGFAGVSTGGPQDADSAMQAREKLLRDLPDFLQRNVGGQSEGEVFFYAILARLFQRGLLERGAPPGEAVADAFDAVRNSLDDSVPRHFLFATSSEMIQVSRGMPGAWLRMEGLTNEAAEAIDPTLTDSSLGRERLRRFRATWFLGGMSSQLDTDLALPEGVELLGQSANAQIRLNKDFSCSEIGT